jgi:hypothetical protein
MKSIFRSPILAQIFSLPKDELHDSLCKRLSGWPLAKYQLCRLQLHLLAILYKLHASFRSLLGHIRIQLATERPVLSVGATLEWSPRGYLANTRTLARSECIRDLLATYPWADIVDLRIFLMGYDAAEYVNCHTTDIQTEKRISS